MLVACVSEIRLLFAIETPPTLLILLSRQNSLIKKKAAFKIESFTVTVTSGEQINQLLAAKRKKSSCACAGTLDEILVLSLFGTED